MLFAGFWSCDAYLGRYKYCGTAYLGYNVESLGAVDVSDRSSVNTFGHGHFIYCARIILSARF